MAQVTTGLRAVLNSPRIYNFSQALVGARRFRNLIVSKYIRPRDQMKILDLGCGTGEILDHLSNVDYLGIDLSERYVAQADQRYGDRGRFRAGRAEQVDWLVNRRFDLVLSVGVLHHLGDVEAKAIMAAAKSALSLDGRMVTVDPCFDTCQSPLARYLAAKDRGRNVRTEQGYRDLAQPYFETVNSTVRHDLLYIPYTHCVLECSGCL